MYDLLRLGLILLGLYFSVSALLGLVVSSADAFSATRPLTEFFGATFALAIAYAALGFAPAVLLVVANRRIARWCFPDSAPPDLTRSDVLVGAGVALVGVYLLASGAASAVGSGLAAAVSWGVSDDLIRSSLLAEVTGLGIIGLVRAALGLALLYFAARIARAFMRRSPRDPTGRLFTL